MERHKILTGIGAATAAGAGYEIYEHEKKKYDERRQQGAPPPQGGEPQTTVVTGGKFSMWAALCCPEQLLVLQACEQADSTGFNR